jgi:hypothetical protein
VNSLTSSSFVPVKPDRLRLSVVICAHNPKPDLFARTLRALDVQDLPRQDWELLVVDSASASPLGDTLDLSWHGDARIVREDQPGLTRARLRGIREARGELLVFVDDDNILDPDYLRQAQQIAVHRPWLGAWSGSCRPEFQHPPAEWTTRYWGNLVIREVQSDRWSNLPGCACAITWQTVTRSSTNPAAVQFPLTVSASPSCLAATTTSRPAPAMLASAWASSQACGSPMSFRQVDSRSRTSCD